MSSESKWTQESPLATARRYAEADIGKRATSTETKWLYEHPLLWLRVLTVIKAEVEAHIAKSRRDLVDLKPPAGVNPSQEYLRAKAEVDKRAQKRLHFTQLLNSRTEEVKALLGVHPLDRLMMSDIVEVLMDIAELAEAGDMAGVVDKADFWAERIDEWLAEDEDMGL